MFHNIDKYYNI